MSKQEEIPTSDYGFTVLCKFLSTRLNREDYEKAIKIVDNEFVEMCDDCELKCSDDERRGEPIPWGDLD